MDPAKKKQSLIDRIKSSKTIVIATVVIALVAAITSFSEDVSYILGQVRNLAYPVSERSELSFALHELELRGKTTSKTVNDTETTITTDTPMIHASVFVSNSGSAMAVMKNAIFLDAKSAELFRCFFGEESKGVDIEPGTNKKSYSCSGATADISEENVEEELQRICAVKFHALDAAGSAGGPTIVLKKC